MGYLWDYPTTIKSTKAGKLLILERKINFGTKPGKTTKIKLSEVKKNWNKLKLQPRKKRLFELLIWGK
ncbi:MAG: hypothetical protein A3D24_02870 [Candidatus Blackburnbacteria bacterium RIFCSPHIGHO2_02_FULL_39_13]|uniref:Uncharacterized protein n=1 Tax=Candidatus Blackburnbacteria bacterium RIFCSPLOWO2_01_FULL_40_20 TaxID=1797519 RepID=A0A1G1VBM0_9BACT|nr:MAG: hypothetical protein A2694_01775 [Candidatus Blackburnbacteria bacterium RIFCSPHIGHO2_01_FULL_40_17]OGY07766.1 MAG: hypothetical protein A3D24_02870 [Candidatus Blackburnbacteria bacterium RIFCSPHIGHO2_02_FULL_39_13]OGY12825.1 MAG: hypothetical protein A3A77_03035 [Candidatus Blackburnbacteria bacterium RIFCSPLOWO2_01_FULL_40_20]